MWAIFISIVQLREKMTGVEYSNEVFMDKMIRKVN